MTTPAVLTHGGVGSPVSWSDGTLRAAQAAWKLLQDGAGAVEAALAAADILEDEPRFNAGTGALLRLDGRCEMDAALMTGDGRLGAVTCLQGVRHPARVAFEVWRSPHNLLAGSGAIEFARECGFPRYCPITDDTLERLRKTNARLAAGELRDSERPWLDFEWHGTIGVVVRDRDGGFAAVNSTGGTSLMLPGRVGDSPLIGCGFFAGPAGVVAATGHGEEITRRMVSLRVYDRINAGISPAQACQEAVNAWPDRSLSLGLLALSATQWGEAATHEMAWSRLPE